MSTRHGDGILRPVSTRATLADIFSIQVPHWHADALCAQADPEAFFPEKGGSTREAKALCRRCPVMAECIDDALSRGERFGIWGGMSERDRRKLERAGQPHDYPCPYRGCDWSFTTGAGVAQHRRHCPFRPTDELDNQESA